MSMLNNTYGLKPKDTQPQNFRANYVESKPQTYSELSDYISKPSPATSALVDQNSFLQNEASGLRTGLTEMGQQYADSQAANAELQNKLDASKNDLTGPGRTMSNVLAGGTLGLGVASFLDNRKTAKLQRAAMKENLQMARDDQAARKARTAGWSNVFGGNQ